MYTVLISIYNGFTYYIFEQIDKKMHVQNLHNTLTSLWLLPYNPRKWIMNSILSLGNTYDTRRFIKYHKTKFEPESWRIIYSISISIHISCTKRFWNRFRSPLYHCKLAHNYGLWLLYTYFARREKKLKIKTKDVNSFYEQRCFDILTDKKTEQMWTLTWSHSNEIVGHFCDLEHGHIVTKSLVAFVTLNMVT